MRFQLSTLALFVSSRANAVDGALRVTYALVLAVAVLPLVPHALMRGKSDAAAALFTNSALIFSG